jgi:hypothetical protein
MSVVYRDFPVPVVLYRAALLLGTLVLGGLLAARLHPVALALYIACSLAAILWTMGHSCRHCAYHGRRCDLGVSLVATLLFPRAGSPRRFRPYTKVAIWLLAVLLALPIPAGVALVLLRPAPAVFLLFGAYLLAVAAVIWTTTLSCPHCAMRGICPLSFYRPAA